MSPRDAILRKQASPSHTPSPAELAATPKMCHICFDALLQELQPQHHASSITSSKRSALRHSTSSTLSEQSSSSSLLDSSTSCPLFVTWEISSSKQSSDINSSSSYQLRGCIGTLSPRTLNESTLKEYAILSALRDRRFDPVSKQELPYLRVAVSLLVNYEECRDCHDWIVGVHGIIIKFYDKNNNPYSATYLPEVASEQQWSVEQTVQSLIKKTGYRGNNITSDSFLRKIHTTRYQSSKCRVSYQEYVNIVGGGRGLLLEEHGNVVALVDDDDDGAEKRAAVSCVIL